MKRPVHKKVLVLSHYLLNDPPTQNTVRILADKGMQVIYFQQGGSKHYTAEETAGFRFLNISDFQNFKPAALRTLLRWMYYKLALRKLIRREKPAAIITFMLHPLAALPLHLKTDIYSCIYDIPGTEGIGKLDRLIYENGFKRLTKSKLVWASDEYKADLCAKRAGLVTTPLVCYNCPPLNYLTSLPAARDPWLRDSLSAKGIDCKSPGSSIMLRAGAIGPYGGIEQTLAAMKSLPDNFVFLMMGRPGKSFKDKITDLVADYKLEKRVYIWENPDDAAWKKILSGADIGHLVHLQPAASENAYLSRNYELNSSLSNNRLFQYMAAGLPVLSYNDPRLEGMHREVACFSVADTGNLETSIATQWRALAADPALRISMGMAGRKAHRDKYNWETQFAPILQSLC